MARKEGEPGLVGQLREAIQGSKMSLNELARQCGVGPDRLSRFVRGQRDLTLEAAEKICDTLGLRLAPEKQRRKEK